jgi:hypothetical protein
MLCCACFVYFALNWSFLGFLAAVGYVVKPIVKMDPDLWSPQGTVDTSQTYL